MTLNYNDNGIMTYNNARKGKSMYIIRDKEAGNIIDQFLTAQDAENALEEYETADKADGTYTPDFYEIVIE